MSLVIRFRTALTLAVVVAAVLALAVLVPSPDADAVDGPVDVVFIARSDDFADALAGGPLAALRGAPLLLTTTDGVSPDTATELERLDPDTIIILGGPVAISDATKTALEAYAGAGGVHRLFGANRFETAAKIAAFLPDKATDADLLDGKDSTSFLGVADKAADADTLDGMDSNDFVPATVATPFVVQLEADTFVVVAENGPLKMAAFCQSDGSSSMRVSTTVAGAYNEDDTGTFGPGDGWVDLNDEADPGSGEYSNQIDEGVAIVRSSGVLYVMSVDGETNGFGHDIYDQVCTINGIVNSYSGPAGLTAGAENI